MQQFHRRSHKTPYLTIFISFLGVILVGTLLLMLPIATHDGEKLNFVQALFTATSAVCVTGLSCVPNLAVTFTLFGKIIIAILIEIGGLSFLTIAVFFFILTGAKVGISNRFLLREALNQNTSANIVKLIKKIVSISFVIQIIGTIFNILILAIFYRERFTFIESIGMGVFHAISSFNNAGFDVFGTSSSMITMSGANIGDVLLNINTMILIILGGIGFIVISDVLKKKRWKFFSMHTKIVLLVTTILLVGGTLLFYFTNNNMTFLQAMFQSVSARTAGFATIDMNELSSFGYLLMITLMLIGASPCSTGGGVKTTTLFVMICTIFYFAQGKKPKAFKRSIADSSVFKAFTLFSIAIIYVAIICGVISLLDPGVAIRKIIFEVVSAFGTVGLSMGITTTLSMGSLVALCLTMFFGRLGPLTIINLWNSNWMAESNEGVHYIEEKVIIG